MSRLPDSFHGVMHFGFVPLRDPLVLRFPLDDGSGMLVLMGAAIDELDREHVAAQQMECDAGTWLDDEPEESPDDDPT